VCLSSSVAALHLFAVYLDPSNANDRIATMRSMRAAVAPNTHNIIAGDLNFTFNPQERLSFGGEAGSPTDIDVACVAEWDLLFTDAGFKEFHQPGFTCKHSFGFSKLDKVFSDMFNAELDLLEIGCNTIMHPMKLSDHHPISVRVASRQRSGKRVPQWIAKEPELATEVFGVFGWRYHVSCSSIGGPRENVFVFMLHASMHYILRIASCDTAGISQPLRNVLPGCFALLLHGQGLV
jgi:hypothetical protein